MGNEKDFNFVTNFQFLALQCSYTRPYTHSPNRTHILSRLHEEAEVLVKQLLVNRISAAEVLQEAVGLVDDFVHIGIVILFWVKREM